MEMLTDPKIQRH